MSILFLVVDKKEKKISDKTSESLTKITSKEDYVTFKTNDDFDLYSKYETKKKYDFVCLIPNGSEISENFKDILEDYKPTTDSVYLPLVVLTNTKVKGVLNSQLWNYNVADEPGILSHQLAMRQADTTLFGSIIPFKMFFDEENYNKELKYYQHFYFLNKITQNEELYVYGIPKTTLFTDIDLSYSDVDNEEKIKYFKKSMQIPKKPEPETKLETVKQAPIHKL